MKRLEDYSLIKNHIFYRGYHILDYIKTHPNLSELDKMAIKATIMDALVYKELIDPNAEFLNFDTLTIDNNPEHYHYEEHPNVSGIPLWIKEEFRKHSLKITGGLPISLCISKPTSKYNRYCVYDPNTAVSSIFEDATFYNVIYISPTRGIKIDSVRPFVEIEIFGEKYLVDILTKRIFKSSFFKDNYGFEVKNSKSKKTFNENDRSIYNEQIEPNDNLASFIFMYSLVMSIDDPKASEYKYEFEMTKFYHPEAWLEGYNIQKEMETFIADRKALGKIKEQSIKSNLPSKTDSKASK